MIPSYSPLSDADVRKIVEGALDLLDVTGVRVHSPSALRAFEACGATVEMTSKTARLPRSMVEDAIASSPSSVTLWSRDGKHDAVLETGQVYFGTGGSALHVLDLDTGERRRSTTADLVLSARLADTLENVDIFQINLFSGEIEEAADVDLNRFFHALNSTTKHVMGGVMSSTGGAKVIDMAAMIAGGADRLRAMPIVSFVTALISPLSIDRESGELMCVAGREMLPIVVSGSPVCGSTSPITLASNLLLHTAEALGGMSLLQCVRKGTPGLCGCVGSIADLRSMRHLGGAVERAMLNAAMAQITRHLGIPLYASAGATESKQPDVQSGFETAVANVLVGLSGANYIHNAVGHMESALTVSFEKMVVDNDIIGMVRRVFRGIEITDDTLALDLIRSQGPGGNFMMEEHTLRSMRTEFFTPRVANRDLREELRPGDDALGRARAFVDEVRRTPHQDKLSAAIRTQVFRAFPQIRPA